jgi:hypothetical protein
MSSQITVAHRNAYNNMAALLLQQRGSKLYNAVTRKQASGAAYKIMDQIGSVAAQANETRHGDVQYQNTPHAARWVHPLNRYAADMLDTADKLKAVIDLQPQYIESQMNALGREIDTQLVTKAFGTCYTGQAGTTSEAWSSSYEIASGSLGLTIDKIRDAKRLMFSADWDDANDEGFIVVSSQQMDDLYGMTQVTSKDFNGGSAVMVDGKVTRVLGLNVIRISDDILPVTSTVRDVLVFAKSGLALGIWKDLSTSIDQIPTKFNNTQILSEMMIGATRTELGKVVKIKCQE